MNTQKKTTLFFIPVLIAIVIFLLDILISSLIENLHIAWIFLIQAALYFGFGFYLVITFWLRKQYVQAKYLFFGLATGVVAFYLTMLFGFSLNCAVTGVCL